MYVCSETCTVLSGYGVVCEVFEAALGDPAAGGGGQPSSVSFKARAVHRFRLKDMPKRAVPVALYNRYEPTTVAARPGVPAARGFRYFKGLGWLG